MSLCLAEPVPASGEFVKGDSGLDFQAVMQLEKMEYGRRCHGGIFKTAKVAELFCGGGRARSTGFDQARNRSRW